MGWFKDFTTSFAASTAAGLTQGLADAAKAQESGLGTMLSEGTQSDFDKYVAARQAAVKGEYDKYTTKFDAFEQQAKEFASLVGSPSAQNLSTELDGMEAAARFMQGKSQSEIQDTIAKLKAIRDEGGNVRERVSDLIKRGKDQEVRNYTAQDVARMQLGGAFSYTAKPYDLSKRRTGLARFLRDDLGLYGETFAKERGDLAERQARDITASLPGYDKYAGTGASSYDKPQASLSFAGLDLRTEAQRRAERKDVAQTEKAEFDLTNARRVADQNQALHIQNMHNAWLQQQIAEGTLTDQDVERTRKKALAVIRGDAQIEAVAKAQEAFNKDPSPENKIKLQSTREDYRNQQVASDFYKNVSDEVTRLKELDPRFKSKKKEGLVQGASTEISGYTGAQAAAAEEKLWRQTTARLYMSMKTTYADTVDLSPLYMHMKPQDIRTMTGLADTIRMGFDRLGMEKTDGAITFDVIRAGVSGSPEQKEQKLKEYIVFAAENGIPIRDDKGNNVATKQEDDTSKAINYQPEGKDSQTSMYGPYKEQPFSERVAQARKKLMMLQSQLQRVRDAAKPQRDVSDTETGFFGGQRITRKRAEKLEAPIIKELGTVINELQEIDPEFLKKFENGIK